jgi:hypothetical protein
VDRYAGWRMDRRGGRAQVRDGRPRQGGRPGRRRGQQRLLQPRLTGKEGLLPVVERLEALDDAEEALRELRVRHHEGGALNLAGSPTDGPTSATVDAGRGGCDAAARAG